MGDAAGDCSYCLEPLRLLKNFLDATALRHIRYDARHAGGVPSASW